MFPIRVGSKQCKRNEIHESVVKTRRGVSHNVLSRTTVLTQQEVR